MKARLAVLCLVAGAALVACSADNPLAPGAATGARAAANSSTPPGAQRAVAGGPTFVPLNCAPKNASYGSALIGPSGGTLYIGSTRLIVPAGALDRKVQISGTIPADNPFQVNLEPHGLQFKKAAGLIIDATSCSNVPDIVYLIDQYTTSDPIKAVYSNWWHTFACPIWHFSGYAIAFRNDPDADASSSE